MNEPPIDPEDFLRPMDNDVSMLPFGIASLAITIFFMIMIVVKMAQQNNIEDLQTTPNSSSTSLETNVH